MIARLRLHNLILRVVLLMEALAEIHGLDLSLLGWLQGLVRILRGLAEGHAAVEVVLHWGILGLISFVY